MRNPLPPRSEDALFDYVRNDLGLGDSVHFTARSQLDLGDDTRGMLKDRSDDPAFWQRKNPVVRHTVLRRRAILEARGLLPRIAVDVHPTTEDEKPFFAGFGLLTNAHIDSAYRAAEDFTRLLGQRIASTGFLKSLILQRICSSAASGLATARRLLERGELDEEGLEPESKAAPDLSAPTEPEREALVRVVEALESAPTDPKLDAVFHYLFAEPRWIEHGCIVFSQYYDTAAWVAGNLAQRVGPVSRSHCTPGRTGAASTAARRPPRRTATLSRRRCGRGRSAWWWRPTRPARA